MGRTLGQRPPSVILTLVPDGGRPAGAV